MERLTARGMERARFVARGRSSLDADGVPIKVGGEGSKTYKQPFVSYGAYDTIEFLSWLQDCAYIEPIVRPSHSEARQKHAVQPRCEHGCTSSTSKAD